MADFYGVLWGPAAKPCEPSGATELHKNLPQNPHHLCVSMTSSVKFALARSNGSSFLLITRYEMPFINKSEATERSKDQKIYGKCTNGTNRRSRVWPVFLIYIFAILISHNYWRIWARAQSSTFNIGKANMKLKC